MDGGGGGDGDGEGDGRLLLSRSVRMRIVSRSTGDGLRSLSIYLSRMRTGDGDLSRTLSRVSITRVRS
jgi:hypothetical protein